MIGWPGSALWINYLTSCCGVEFEVRIRNRAARNWKTVALTVCLLDGPLVINSTSGSITALNLYSPNISRCVINFSSYNPCWRIHLYFRSFPCRGSSSHQCSRRINPVIIALCDWAKSRLWVAEEDIPCRSRVCWENICPSIYTWIWNRWVISTRWRCQNIVTSS